MVDKTCQFSKEVRLSLLSAIPKHLTNKAAPPARTDINFPLAASGRHRSGMWERLAITETGVVTVMSRYQVATPSRAITARATGPKVITDSLMRTSSRTPRRLCGVNHRKRLRRPDSNWRHSAYETDGIVLTSPLRDLSSGGWARTSDLMINSHLLSSN